MSKYSLQWTEKTAESYCLEFMNTSKVAMLCSEIPSIDFQGTINNCVADIMVIGLKEILSVMKLFFIYMILYHKLMVRQLNMPILN